jgi:hypothetical protein
MTGAIAPDLDMLYFHLVDRRQHHHHSDATHFPIVWLMLLLASFAWARVAARKDAGYFAGNVSLNGFVHMLLDTTVGDICWFAPFLDRPFALFSVPAVHATWWLNFVGHWSFGLELAVILWAIYLWRADESIAETRTAR